MNKTTQLCLEVDVPAPPLNRLRKIEYTPAGSTVVNALKTVQFFYDETTIGCTSSFAISRMSRFTDESGDTKLCYDRRGNVVQKTQVTSSTTLISSMTYTVADRLSTLSYPSSSTASYGRDSQGRITSVNINGAAFITGVSYLPFGPVSQITFQNGKTLTKTYDQNYDIDSIVSTATNGLNLDYSVDEVGNIIQITQSGAVFNLAYDKLYRLTSVADQNLTLIENFSYDATGNRLTNQRGASTAPLSYTYAPTSHRLINAGDGNRGFDANGNTLDLPQIGPQEYDERNRLVTNGKAYNARGERISKRTFIRAAPLQQFLYNESGALISEASVSLSGKITLTDYVYLDNLPVARVQSGQINPIETDQLGSPRNIQDPTGTSSIWQWNMLANSPSGSNAFGEQAPTGTLTGFNLRFPGQYADEGLHYNYFRDYEPGTGRYVESDPIGLKGGASTYSYVFANPLRLTDPNGHVPLLLLCLGGGCEAAGAAVAWCAAGLATLTMALAADTAIDCANGDLPICQNNDDCYRRWEVEDSACNAFGGTGPKGDPDRWRRACKTRAADRRTLCMRNGGPSPSDPPEWP